MWGGGIEVVTYNSWTLLEQWQLPVVGLKAIPRGDQFSAWDYLGVCTVLSEILSMGACY